MAEYEILEKLGEGGMGVVHRAIQQPLGREVALKRLHASRVHEEVVRRRFLHEIQALMRLSHPGVIRIYDAGEMGDTLYYSMDYIGDARPLAQVIKTEGPLEPGRALDLLRQMLEALAVIHAAGMVHRDIKPSNVLVTARDQVILMDFGLVKDEQATVLTATGDIVGSIPFMAPEMAMGQPASTLTDLWATGLVLYEMLTRRNAYSGPMDQMVKAIVQGPIPSVTPYSPDTPQVVQKLLEQFLQKQPAHRFPDAAAALDATVASEGALRRRVENERDNSHTKNRRRGPVPGEAPPVAAARGAGGGTKGRRRRRIAGGVLGMMLLLTGVLLARSFRGPIRKAEIPAGVPGSAAPGSDGPSTTPLEKVRRATRQLRQLSPYTLLRAMARDFGQSMRPKPGEVGPDPAKDWEPRLASLRDGAQLDRIATDIQEAQEALTKDPGLTREDVMSLHHQVSDLEDLERLISRLRLTWKPVAPLLRLPFHRPLDAVPPASLQGALEGVAYRFTNAVFPVGFEKKLDAAPELKSLATGFPSPFLTWLDPRDPPLAGGIDFGGGVCQAREPLDPAARGADRVDVLMASAMKEASIRLLVSRDPKAPPDRWTPIGRFHGIGVEPAWVGHSLPPSLLEPVPLHLRIEAIPDHGGFLEPQGMGETTVFVWAVLFRRTAGRPAPPVPPPADLEQVLAESLESLEKLDPRRLLGQLFRALEKVGPAADRPEKLRAVRVWWEVNARKAMMASEARHAIEQLVPHLASLHEGVGPRRGAIRKLYRLRHDLEQLETFCQATGMPFPALAGKLATPAYDRTPGGGKVVSGAAVIFGGGAGGDEPSRLPARPTVNTVRSAATGKLETERDPLDPGTGSGDEPSASAPTGRERAHVWMAQPITLPLRPETLRARIQLDVSEVTARTGFRVFTAPSPSAPPAAWKLLAFLRPDDVTRPLAGPAVLEHVFPPSLLGSDTHYLVASLSLDHRSRLPEDDAGPSRGIVREMRLVFEQK